MKLDSTPTPTPVNGTAPPGMSFAEAQMQAHETRRTYTEFEVPDIMPLEEREVTYGGQRLSIQRILLKRPTVPEERRVYARAGNDSNNAMIIAMLQTMEGLAFVVAAPVVQSLGPDGQPKDEVQANALVEYPISTTNGSAEIIYGSMHPAMRHILILAYQSSVMPSEATSGLFVESRRTVTR